LQRSARKNSIARGIDRGQGQRIATDK